MFGYVIEFSSVRFSSVFLPSVCIPPVIICRSDVRSAYIPACNYSSMFIVSGPFIHGNFFYSLRFIVRVIFVIDEFFIGFQCFCFYFFIVFFYVIHAFCKDFFHGVFLFRISEVTIKDCFCHFCFSCFFCCVEYLSCFFYMFSCFFNIMECLPVFIESGMIRECLCRFFGNFLHVDTGFQFQLCSFFYCIVHLLCCGDSARHELRQCCSSFFCFGSTGSINVYGSHPFFIKLCLGLLCIDFRIYLEDFILFSFFNDSLCHFFFILTVECFSCGMPVFFCQSFQSCIITTAGNDGSWHAHPYCRRNGFHHSVKSAVPHVFPCHVLISSHHFFISVRDQILPAFFCNFRRRPLGILFCGLF